MTRQSPEHRRNSINDQKGFALVGLVCMMLLLAVAAVAINRQAGMQARRAANLTLAAQNYLGEGAAIEHAVWSLMQDPTWRTAAGGEDYAFEGVTYNRKVLETGTIGCSKVITVTITPPDGVESLKASFLWHPETLTIADTENHRVRAVDPATGIIDTVAGTGSGGYNGDSRLATTAKLDKPNGVWLDASCNLFIADTDNSRIRKVVKDTGMIETVAGTGTDGYSGDGGLAIAAGLRKPRGVSVAPSGDIYIADTDNHVIRKGDGATGIISTYAGTGSAGYSGDGGWATWARLDKPGVVFANASAVYIADTENHCIRKVFRLLFVWIIDTVAGTGSSGYSGDGGPATSAKLDKPRGVYVDTSGNIFIADTENSVIRRVDINTGNIATVAGTGSSGDSGDGGPATSAKLDKPRSICINLPASLTTPLERIQ